MEVPTKIAWALLALLHVTPAAIVFAPGLVKRLYGVPPGGEIGILLAHRGALFLAVCNTTVYAFVDPDVRRLASLILLVSVVGFLVLYMRAGKPAGELRKIASADLAGLLPLGWVTLNAWR